MNEKYELSFLSAEEGSGQRLSRELIHAWNQMVLREHFPDTPVGFHSGEEKQQAIAEWNRQREEYLQRHEYVLLPTALPDCGFFVGRQEELEDVLRILLEGDGRTRLVLHGMGGMGKTTLARQAVERLKDRYEKVLWLSCRRDLVHTICDDSQLKIKTLTWSGERCRNQKEYFREKWRILCSLLCRERVLLVLDDMKEVREQSWSLLRELPCDVLVTSRLFRPAWQAAELAIRPLQDEADWQAFYQGFSVETLTPFQREQLDAYRQTVQGNTLLMRLAVCNPELCAKLEPGMETYFLRINALHATQIQALRYLSLLPADGMEVSRFLHAADLKEEVLTELEQRSLVWLQGQGNERICGLHPVIAESVQRIYRPVPENCSRFLSGLAADYTDIWNRPYGGVHKAIPICFSMLGAWNKVRAWLADTYDTFATVLWIGGYFEESLHYMMKVYDACVEYYGAVHQVTGSIALRVGAVYHNSLRFDEAMEWYLTAFNTLMRCERFNVEYHYRLMQAAHKVARARRHEGDCDAAMEYLAVAEQAIGQYRRVKTGRPILQKGEAWFVALEKAKILAAMGKTDQAAVLCEEIEAGYRSEFPDRQHLLTELNLLRAELLLKQNRVSEALALSRECLVSAKTMRGEMAKETLGCLEMLADALCADGQYAEAEIRYRKLRDCLKQQYPRQKAWVQRIDEKEQTARKLQQTLAG